MRENKRFLLKGVNEIESAAPMASRYLDAGGGKVNLENC